METSRINGRGIAVLATLLLGCSGPALGGGGDPVVRAELVQVPAGVQCVRINVALTGKASRYDFGPAQIASGVMEIGNLPAGPATFSGNAYNASCANVGNGTAANWITSPVDVTLSAGENVSVQLVFRMPGGADVTGTFQGPRLDLLAGQPFVPGTVDGIGKAARFAGPGGMVTDGVGNLYVAEHQTIRRVAIATGEVTTLAGDPTKAPFQDGVGSMATFNQIQSIAFDGSKLYIFDSGVPDGPPGRLRILVVSTGQVTTLLGSSLLGPVHGMVFVPPQTLYVANWGYLLKIDLPSHDVSMVAGAVPLGTADGQGAAASFYGLSGLAWDGANALYGSDMLGGTIRKIDLTTFNVTTVAGNTSTREVDGTGAAAFFASPVGLGFRAGLLYVADRDGGTVRRVDVSTRAVTTVVGLASGPDHRPNPLLDFGPLPASLYAPAGLVVLPGGDFVISDSNVIAITRGL